MRNDLTYQFPHPATLDPEEQFKDLKALAKKNWLITSHEPAFLRYTGLHMILSELCQKECMEVLALNCKWFWMSSKTKQ